MAHIPTGPEALGGKGADHENEIAKYEAMLAQDPKSRAFALLAEAYRKSGRFDDAVRTAREGLKHYPYYLSGRVALARALFDAGQREPAREEFERVISAAPDNLMAHRHLAEIYLEAGKRIEAAKSLKMVVLLDPRDGKAREKLNSIGPEPKAAMPAGGDFGTLLDSHRYEAPPPPPPPAPPSPPAVGMPTPTEQKIVHRPEPSKPSPPKVAAEKAPAEVPAFGEIEVPQFMEEPLVGQGTAPGIREAGELPPASPAPRERAGKPAAVKPPAPSALMPLPPPSAPAPAAPAAAAGPASPWDEIVEEVLPAGEPPDELNTETLAEIYVQQGFYDKALAIYQKLLPAQPRNVRLLQKVEEIQSLVKMAGRPAWGGAVPEAPGTAPAAALPVKPGAGAPPRKEQPAGGKSSRDEEALKTLRLWMDRLRTEKR